MINDRGFVLIAVLFMLVSLISVILACAYIPISEQREEARLFITYMNFHRYKRAIFGRLADQGGGEFTSCGGAISELPEPTLGEPFYASYCSKRFYTKGARPPESGYKGHPFEYSASYGYWGGYRGKRYVYPLPSDDWDDEADYRYCDGEDDTSGSFLNGFGSRFTIGGRCASDLYFYTGFLGEKEGILYNGEPDIYLYLKDYTKRLPDDEIKLKLISCGVPQHYLKYQWTDLETTEDFILHRYKITDTAISFFSSCAGVLHSGFKKVLIQINEGTPQNPRWVARYTTGIVVPQWNSLRISPRISLTIREDDIGIK